MMKVIEEDFANFINQFEWHNANYPVVQNVNAKGETDAEVIKRNMVKQLYLPVQFIQSTKWLINQGVVTLLKLDREKYYLGLSKNKSRCKNHFNSNTRRCERME